MARELEAGENGDGEFLWCSLLLSGISLLSPATRMVDICLEAGLTMFDSADIYSNGLAEEILGAAIKGRRDKVIISTKTSSDRAEIDVLGVQSRSGAKKSRPKPASGEPSALKR